MTTRLTILGCGSSGGVPRIGQGWGACDPSQPKNARLRCSILVERMAADGGKTVVLVDTSPDLRQQLLKAETTRLDAVILTHPHADHTHGIDDVRALVLHMKKRVDIFMDEATRLEMRTKFAYVFETPPGSSYPPIANARRLVSGAALRIEGAGGPIDMTPFELDHGDINALGLRIDDVAYTPDLNGIPAAAEPFLRDLDLWIVDALRYTRHPSHFSLHEALAAVERFKPRRAILTNLHNDLDYATLKAEIPEGVVPAFDGMGQGAPPPGQLSVRITSLEMLARPARAAAPVPGTIRIERAIKPSVAFYRFLYNGVGEPWLWAARRRWSDQEIAVTIHDPAVEVWVLSVDGQPAGYAELDRRLPDTVELAYFGLMPAFVGRGFGPHLLRFAIDKAWDGQPRRLWVHTCSLDHPAALGLYRRLGFEAYKVEDAVEADPRLEGLIRIDAAPHIPLA